MATRNGRGETTGIIISIVMGMTAECHGYHHCYWYYMLLRLLMLLLLLLLLLNYCTDYYQTHSSVIVHNILVAAGQQWVKGFHLLGGNCATYVAHLVCALSPTLSHMLAQSINNSCCVCLALVHQVAR